MKTPHVVICGAFDDLRSQDMRLLQEASVFGALTVLVWMDERISQVTGRPPRLPIAERRYLLEATRYVEETLVLPPETDADALPPGLHPDIWADRAQDANDRRRDFCDERSIRYLTFTPDDLAGFPELPAVASNRRKVIVTGCYDWFHSGHVRFFEEAASYGDLTVCVGNDANIRLLKGEGHPLLSQEERRYMVASIKHVSQALITTGEGWLDAEPEIQALKPDYYVVNEDGDKGGKREYCSSHGIEYVVLKRTPAPGLPRRSSTDLRGF